MPLVWGIGWKVFGLSINGYLNCLLLAFLFGCALSLYYILLASLNKQIVSWAVLLVSYVVVFLLVSYVPRLG